MLQFTDDQKHEILSLIQQNRKVEAVKLVRESANLGLYDAKSFVDSLMESPEILNDFIHNIQRESQSVDYNFSTRKIKFTDKDGKTVEIDDQHPEWQNIQKQFNVDLSQPDSLQNLIQQFSQNHTENRIQTSEHQSNNFQQIQTNTSPISNAGIEDLSKKEHFGRVMLIIAILFLLSILYLYFQKN